MSHINKGWLNKRKWKRLCIRRITPAHYPVVSKINVFSQCLAILNGRLFLIACDKSILEIFKIFIVKRIKANETKQNK